MDQKNLLESLGGKLNDADPVAFLKTLIIQVCVPENNLNEKKHRPERPILNLEDVQKLSDADLENFAEVFIEKNEYLYKKREEEKTTDNEGNERSHLKYTVVEHPKLKNEGNIEYLYRLYCAHHDNLYGNKSLIGSIPKLDSFSTALSADITKNLLLGEALTNAVKVNSFVKDWQNDAILQRGRDMAADFAELH